MKVIVDRASLLYATNLVSCAVVAAEGYDLIARPLDELEKRVGLAVLH